MIKITIVDNKGDVEGTITDIEKAVLTQIYNDICKECCKEGAE